MGIYRTPRTELTCWKGIAAFAWRNEGIPTPGWRGQHVVAIITKWPGRAGFPGDGVGAPSTTASSPNADRTVEGVGWSTVVRPLTRLLAEAQDLIRQGDGGTSS